MTLLMWSLQALAVLIAYTVAGRIVGAASWRDRGILAAAAGCSAATIAVVGAVA